MADTVLAAGQDGADAAAPDPETALMTATEAAPPQPVDISPQDAASAQADQAQKADPADGEDEGKVESGAPEEYADFDIPEGLPVDEAALVHFKGLAKEMHLSQEQAQKLVTFQAEAVRAQQEAWQRQAESWVDDLKNDPEIGGNGYSENVAVAAKAIDRFGSPELRQYLNDTMLGNHPELVKFAYRVGKAISEDPGVGGAKAAGQQKSREEILYGKN